MSKCVPATRPSRPACAEPRTTSQGRLLLCESAERRRVHLDFGAAPEARSAPQRHDRQCPPADTTWPPSHSPPWPRQARWPSRRRLSSSCGTRRRRPNVCARLSWPHETAPLLSTRTRHGAGPACARCRGERWPAIERGGLNDVDRQTRSPNTLNRRQTAAAKPRPMTRQPAAGAARRRRLLLLCTGRARMRRERRERPSFLTVAPALGRWRPALRGRVLGGHEMVNVAAPAARSDDKPDRGFWSEDAARGFASSARASIVLEVRCARPRLRRIYK